MEKTMYSLQGMQIQWICHSALKTWLYIRQDRTTGLLQFVTIFQGYKTGFMQADGYVREKNAPRYASVQCP